MIDNFVDEQNAEISQGSIDSPLPLEDAGEDALTALGISVRRLEGSTFRVLADLHGADLGSTHERRDGLYRVVNYDEFLGFLAAHDDPVAPSLTMTLSAPLVERKPRISVKKCRTSLDDQSFHSDAFPNNLIVSEQGTLYKINDTIYQAPVNALVSHDTHVSHATPAITSASRYLLSISGTLFQ